MPDKMYTSFLMVTAIAYMCSENQKQIPWQNLHQKIVHRLRFMAALPDDRNLHPNRHR